MILIVHRKNFNYINIKHSTIQYIRIKLLTTSHGQNETFETFSNKNKNSRSKKKKIPREILTMDFPSALGCSRLPAKVRTYKIYSYRVKLRKSRKERKFQRKPMEGIEEDIRWSGGNKRKMKLLQRRKMTFPMVREGKAPKNQAGVGWVTRDRNICPCFRFQ